MNVSEPSSDQNGRVPVVFLPGILMPVALRYAPLLRELDGAVQAVTKELEVYATEPPPAHHTIEVEVEGISRAADAAGFESFHLYGHSGGGACALAYAAAHPERVLSLAVDEPASDFSPEDQAERQVRLATLDRLSPSERLPTFLKWQLAPGVELPGPASGPPPDWMANRPAGVNAFMHAITRYRLDLERLRTFDRPVYYSYGSLSSPEWEAKRDRLNALFPDFTAERYDGASHFNTSHLQDPARVASALRRLWQRAGRGGGRGTGRGER